MLKEHLDIIKGKRLLKHGLSDFDIECLIKEVERVKELEQQNKRYEEALRFYADKDNYKMKNNGLIAYVPINVDKGEIARNEIENVDGGNFS